MTEPSLLVTMLLAGGAFLTVAIVGFVFFTRFMAKEKERGERFRAIHGNERPATPPDELTE